jgi:hypothetical protein
MMRCLWVKAGANNVCCRNSKHSDEKKCFYALPRRLITTGSASNPNASNVASRLPGQCRDVGQPCWGLTQVLKHKDLVDSTLAKWRSEFSRTP